MNADDFGLSAGVNKGIIRCHEAGVVTSASLMVRWPSADAAAEYARVHTSLSVGLHIDLGEWAYSSGAWLLLYEVVTDDDPAAIRAEILHQLDTFQRLTGCSPTHIDSHQHVHRRDPVRSVVAEISDRLGVPYREGSEQVRYRGDFYGQTADGRIVDGSIDVERLIEILRTLPDGTTELGCHPGFGNDVRGMYVDERTQEAGVLCDPRVRAAIEVEGIALISFRDVAMVHGA